ncbi:MAG: transporter substrate-binding domain-containing protein [Idiomarina sp.]|nr:transporter substrate-binding domain-containing protein [Idiomarina sp.]
MSHFQTLILGIGLSLAIAVSPSKAETIHLVATEYEPHYSASSPNNGPMFEIIRAALAEAGYELEITFMPFARTLHEAERGRAAGVAGIWFVEERLNQFYYSQPLYANQLAFFARKDRKIQFNTPDDLVQQELVFGSVIGYDQPMGVLDSGVARQETGSDRQLMEMLLTRRVDVIAADVANGLFQLHKWFPEQYDDVE